MEESYKACQQIERKQGARIQASKKTRKQTNNLMESLKLRTEEGKQTRCKKTNEEGSKKTSKETKNASK